MVKQPNSEFDPNMLEELLKAEKIMVVDDEEIITNIISRFFPQCQVSLFLDSTQALDHYKESTKTENPFTLIISDIFMPKMDGLTLLQKIREVEKEAKIRTMVVVMSGFGDKGRLKRAQELGVDGFIDKPFLKKTFLECLYAVLKNREMEN